MEALLLRYRNRMFQMRRCFQLLNQGAGDYSAICPDCYQGFLPLHSPEMAASCSKCKMAKLTE